MDDVLPGFFYINNTMHIVLISEKSLQSFISEKGVSIKSSQGGQEFSKLLRKHLSCGIRLYSCLNRLSGIFVFDISKLNVFAS